MSEPRTAKFVVEVELCEFNNSECMRRWVSDLLKADLPGLPAVKVSHL